MMAADCKGTSVKTIQRSIDRNDLIDCGATLVASEQRIDHKIDTFRISKANGSFGRALVHGLLDITTSFLWELAATPIELSYAQDKFYTVKVVFDLDDKIQSIEIL